MLFSYNLLIITQLEDLIFIFISSYIVSALATDAIRGGQTQTRYKVGLIPASHTHPGSVWIGTVSQQHNEGCEGSLDAIRVQTEDRADAMRVLRG